MISQLPDDYLPDWAKYLIATVIGAGGLHWFRAWLENKRLERKEFREILLDRIRELESVVACLQKRMGNLRVEMAHLEVENRQLKRELGLETMEVEHAHDETSDRDDDGEPA